MSNGASETYTTDYAVETSGATQGMNELLAITNQYAAAADNTLGRITRLQTGLVSMTRSITGLKPANSVAVSEAARYQQALAGQEARTRVAIKGNDAYRKSFHELQKTTLELGRKMPVSLGQAVDQVSELQRNGVHANKEVAKLAKGFTDLGAATGEYAPALSRDMLQVSRTMGANYDQVLKYNDALTTLTATQGGTASGTLAFAKQIAPIAATVGIGEGKVLGLSNAFSKLGEDGGSAATAVNKVMIDLNRSITRGTPEIGTYARLLDVSTDQLTTLFKEKPDQVLSRFVDAIGKKGPEAIASLEDLGLDGVRTTRAIQAAARNGGLQQAMDAGVAAYGNGSTREAARTATEGLNDELSRLQETTRQNVMWTGAPMLGFLTDLTKGANAAAEAVNKLVSSGPAQKAQGVLSGVNAGGGVLGMIGGGVVDVARIGLMAALGRNLLVGGGRMGTRLREDFRIGRTAAYGGASTAAAAAEPGVRSGLAARAGAYYATASGSPGAEPGTPWAITPRGIVTGAARRGYGNLMRGANILGNTMGLTYRSFRYDVEQARGDARPVSPQRQAYQEYRQDRFERADRAAREAGRSGLSMRERAAITAEARGQFMRSSFLPSENAGTMRSLFAPGGGVRNAGAEFMRSTGAGLGYVATRGPIGWAGRGIGSALGMVGGPGGAAVLAAGALGYGAIKSFQSGRDADNSVKGGLAQSYSAFNDFAAKVGLASRSISQFTDAATAARERLANTNPTLGNAYEFSGADYNAARSTSADAPIGLELSKRERGEGDGFWNRVGRWTTRKSLNPFNSGKTERVGVTDLLERAQLTLGDQATPQAVAQILSDYARQGFNQPTVTAVGKRLQGVYGSTGRATPSYDVGIDAAVRAQSLAPNAFKTTDTEAAARVRETFGLAGQRAQRVGDIYGDQAYQAKAGYETNELLKRFISERENATGDRKDYLDRISGAVATGVADQYGFKASDVKDVFDKVSSVPDLVKELRGKDDISETTRKGLDSYDAAVKLGIDPTDPTGYMKVAQTPGYRTRAGAAFGRLDEDYSSATGRTATSSLEEGLFGVDDKLRRMGKTLDEGGQGLVPGMSKLQKALYRLDTEGPTTGRTYRAAQQLAQTAMSQYGGNVGIAQLALTQAKANQDSPGRRDALDMAKQMVETFAPLRQAQGSQLGNIRDQLQATRVASRQLAGDDSPEAQDEMLKLASQRNDLLAQGVQMRRQYEQQIIDTFRNIRIARENSQIAEQRMTEDFNRSQLYAAEDYHRSISRAERDFQIQMGRAQEDFYRNRERAIADHNRQVGYMIKDSAKNLMDPYQRIPAPDIMDTRGLAGNINEQVHLMNMQVKNIKRLKKLGLSQDAIDALDLYNPANAYQTQRLVEDIENDRNSARQLNRAVEAKIEVGGKLVTGSEDFRRSEREFQRSLDRMNTDQRTAMRRARADNRKSLGDAASDFATAQSRIRAQHSLTVSRMHADVERSASLSMQELVRTGQQMNQTAKWVSDQAGALIANAPARWAGPLSRAIGQLRQMLVSGLDLRLQVTSSRSSNQTRHVPSSGAGGAGGRIPAGSGYPDGRAAHGMIVNRPMNMLMGEAGHPEAVLPLNDRGAAVLAAVLERYTGGDAVRHAIAKSYATPVGSGGGTYLYDHSTKVMGPVTVQAQDPEEMGRKLEEKAVRRQLVQPVGSRG